MSRIWFIIQIVLRPKGLGNNSSGPWKDIRLSGKNRHIPVILVLFPFTFQFDDVDTLSTPQKIVNEYANSDNVPWSFAPVLFKKMEEEGIKPDDLFLDRDHLSPVGSQIVAEILADFIQQESFLTDHPGTID